MSTCTSAAPSTESRHGRRELAFVLFLNLMPIVGVLAWGWRVGEVMALFWAETLLIGLFLAGHMTLVRADTAADLFMKWFAVAFFAGLFGLATTVHGSFVAHYFAGGAAEAVAPWRLLADFAGLYDGFVAALAVLAALHLVRTVREIRAMPEAGAGHAVLMMFLPLGRLAVLHLALLGTGVFALALGGPLAALVLLLVLKTAMDLAWWRLGVRHAARLAASEAG